MIAQPQDQLEELRDNFQIRFEGDKNQIDANTFVNYLIHFNTIVQEINRELEPDRKITVKINALSEGSFIVDIELLSVLEQIKQLFSEGTVGYLAEIFGVYQGIIFLKERLAGKKPKEVTKEGNTVIIVLEDGATLQINRESYALYSNSSTINQALSKQFETLEQDPEIEGVQIIGRNEEPIVNVIREEFPVLASSNDVPDSGATNEVRDNAILNIIKLSFDPKLKSDFYYHGIKITAQIKDKAFYDLVDKGEQFAKGDSLEVRIQVNRVFDQSVDTDVIKGYEILEVIRHHPRGDRNQLVIEMGPKK
ncbi:hypothetical protein BH09BAC4_BH09BAC4_23980 [soil metagenome]